MLLNKEKKTLFISKIHSLKSSAQNGKKHLFAKGGFSLVELIIVIALIAIALMITSYSWQRYVLNSNLRSGARKVATDFKRYQERAISEGREYGIAFNQADNNYDIWALAKDDLADVGIMDVTPAEDSIADNAQITAVDFTGCSVVRFTRRGLVGHCAVAPVNENDTGTVTLTNRRGATATVTINLRGKVDVTFTGL